MTDKLFIVLRGLPGSGKSTFAKEVKNVACQNGLSFLCASTDDYWKAKKIIFNSDYLSAAHQWNFQRVEQAMKDGVQVVVLDNTNIKKSHFSNYLLLASSYGYDVRVEIIGRIDERSINEYFHRNVHNVPIHTIERMAREFEAYEDG